MEFLNTIYENPFRILGASPLDDRRRLITLADEASLLGVENAEEALNLLLNAQKRLEAEINWFPSTPAAQAEAVLSYPDNPNPAPYPQIESPSALALFNACRVLLESWKITDLESAAALCKSLALVDCAIQPDALMQEINRDREKAGFPPLTDSADLSYRLDGLRHSAAQRIMDRIGESSAIRDTAMMGHLARMYKIHRSPLIEIMMSIHELKISDQRQNLMDEMIRLSSGLSALPSDAQRQQSVNTLLSKLNAWHNLTQPIRALQTEKGLVGDDSRKLFHDIRETAVALHNTHHMIDACYNIIKALQNVFWDVPGAQEMLTKDIALLEPMRRQMEALRRMAQYNAR